MSTAAIIAIAIGVVVVLAAIVFVTTGPAQSTSAAPARCRARPAGATKRHAAPVPTPRPARAAADEPAPTGTGVAVLTPRKPSAPATRLAARHRCCAAGGAGAVGPARPRGDRRQPPAVLQPRHRHADERRHRRLLRRRLRRLPVADGDRRVRPGRRRRQARRHHRSIRTGDGFFYAPSARTWITEYPADALPEGRGGLRRRASSPAWSSGHRRPLPEVPAPRLPRAVRAPPASGSSARATARSTTGSVRRRPARRPRGMDRFPHHASPATATSPSTPARSSPGPPIGTNTTGQEAEGPHCITGGGEH